MLVVCTALAAILAVTTAPFWSSTEPTALSAISALPIALSAISVLPTELSAILAAVTALSASKMLVIPSAGIEMVPPRTWIRRPG